LTFDLPWLSGTFPVDEQGKFVDRDRNPFNPDVVDVRAVFSLPGSVGAPDRIVEVFGFWWQDFDVNCKNRDYDMGYEADIYTSKGAPRWKVRFTPQEIGTYHWFVTVREDGRETVKTERHSFEVVDSKSKGFVRVCPDNGMYFQFDDGSPFVAVGANLPHMQSIRASEEYFKFARENRMNFGRIHPIVGDQEIEWVPSGEWGKKWRGIFEHHQYLGRYNLASAWRRDRILDWAEQSGVYLSYAWENGAGELSKGDEYSMWSYHPYNKTRGGMCEDNHEYFSNETARKYTKRRIRYYVARWGYSPNIFLWDGPNELDLAIIQSMWHENDAKWPVVTAWQQEMLRYVKQIDHYGHLQASYSGCYPSEYVILPQYEYLRSAYRLPEADLIHRHIYHPDVIGKITCAFDTFVGALDTPCNDVEWYKGKKNLVAFGKPLWIGEWGRTEKASQDTEEALHDAIWCATLNGGMISLLGTSVT
jgi:hypothetical protein